MTLPKFLTIDEVAAITRAPRSTVFHWIYSDKLRSRRVGKRRLIAEPDLAAFLDAKPSVTSVKRIDDARVRRDR